MRRRKSRPALTSLIGFLCLATRLLAADHPIQGDSLRLRDSADPASRLARFRARSEAAIDFGNVPDPRLLGATLEVVGTGVGDGNSGTIALAAGLWHGLGSPAGSAGYRYADPPGLITGVRRVELRPGTNGGKLSFSARGATWPFSVTQSQEQIEMRLTIGTETWCAEFRGFDFRRNQAGLVVGRLAMPPVDCALPVCGDGTVETPEECDDGNTQVSDGCSDLCHVEPVCGNGTTEGTEECDDGGMVDFDGCSALCQLENTSMLCAGIPSTFGTALDAVLIANGLDNPVHLTAPRLDTNRLFIVEQAGRIRVIRNGALLPTPFLDIADKIQCAPSCGERGLLSLAFHPDYENNGRFFVDYTDVNGDTVIARYQASSDPDLADAGSELVLRLIAQPFANHNGGQLAFGPDGYLYAGMGDGGGVGDPRENGQSDLALLGKLLRFDVDVESPPYYAVPATNPDATAGDPLGLIWAKGLRNPWRFSFDRGTGDMYIGDVGQDSREEVDFQPASSPGGENYGWNAYEGTRCYDPPPHFGSCAAARDATMPPVWNHSHGGTGAPCSITGGLVYRGCRMPDLRGTYFFADFCTDQIQTFTVTGGAAVNYQNRTADLDPPGPLKVNSISSFGEDARGEIYIVDHTGEIFTIVPQ